ncbi:hypothetical protein NKR19_g8215 [Coniochaeta hoffmannii]|uniref:Apple domain-containing protein n=1 Tax=Coniochaeta hoffmannii TaxID=91930 RepID=A0AA38VF21_9PEZI|nr:hypothetical protein NKR19_g8215 [Coniochaeta hoffmannii]
MLIFRLLSAVLGVTLASAQTWSSVSTEYSFPPISCSTEYGSTWVQSIPTSYVRASSTISSFAPVETYTSTEYVQDTASTVATPLTQWSDVWPYATVWVSLPVTTVTVAKTVSSTIATLTSTTTLCNNGPAPTSTVTSFTGSYTPVPGQNTALPVSWEASDTCWVTNIEIQHIHPTVQGPTITTTVPVTIASPTIIKTTTYTTTRTTYASTHTLSPTFLSAHVDYVVTTVTASCAPVPTVTYAAQCAFPNLLGEMSGLGLSIGGSNPNFTFAGVADTAHGDPSLCCQLCVDNAGCAASVYWAQSEACLLGYVGGDGADDCPVAFNYFAVNYTEVPTKPRQGNLFQVGAGCATIKYDGVHTS